MHRMATIPLEQPRRRTMPRRTLGQLLVGIAMASLMVLAAVLPSEAEVRRLLFSSSRSH